MDIQNFYSRRAARILPCLFILLAVLSVLHAAGFKDFMISRPDQSLGGAIFSALGFHLNWYEGQTWYLPASWDVLWSLSIEEVFYLAFPVLCFVLRNEKALAAFFFLFAISLPVIRHNASGSEIWQEKAYLPGMAAISAGVFSALLVRKIRPPAMPIQFFIRLVGLLGVFAVLCFGKWVRTYIGPSNFLLLTLSASCLLVSFYWREISPRLTTQPWIQPLRSYGRLSYEIYLTHMFIVWPIVYAFRATGKNLEWGFMWYIPAILLSWLMGHVVEKYISTPLERSMRQFLTSRLDKVHEPVLT